MQIDKTGPYPLTDEDIAENEALIKAQIIQIIADGSIYTQYGLDQIADNIIEYLDSIGYESRVR